ncbi:hypothetical protein FQV37_2824 [Psychrobacter nivimaris]|uniref:Uncharacterized protein n=1 Tax=Psychrobacter nivimaris TaxID=281738 RepID=A0A6N7C1W7_9GAMM|nr:hypothetical protein FQV37_2824 [Psychrobacter nivimaris]
MSCNSGLYDYHYQILITNFYYKNRYYDLTTMPKRLSLNTYV